MTGRYPIPFVSPREKLLLRRFAAGQAMQPHETRRTQECGAMIEIPKPQSYDSLRNQLRGVVTDLLDRVRDQAANEAERREIIDVYVAQITEIIEDTAMTTKQAFGSELAPFGRPLAQLEA